MEKLRHNYRLVIMNDETFEEIGSYRLSLLNVYVIISLVIVLVALIVGSIIFFTPVRTYVPGYGDLDDHQEAIRLRSEVDELQKLLDANQLYTDNIRRILRGEVVQTAEEMEENVEFPVDSLSGVERIEEDELLRKEIELNEQLQERELLTKTVNYSPADIPLEQIYFVPPVSGIISQEFHPEKKHYGIDLLAPLNTPVKSVMDGYVFTSDWTLETGNTIGIQHANNVISFYKHNSFLLKKVGSYVKAGEAIAIIGNTGELSSGPHLHFELWHNGKAVDPSDYIIFD